MPEQSERIIYLNEIIQKIDPNYSIEPAKMFSKSQESIDVFNKSEKVGTIYGTDDSEDFFYKKITEKDITGFLNRQ